MLARPDNSNNRVYTGNHVPCSPNYRGLLSECLEQDPEVLLQGKRQTVAEWQRFRLVKLGELVNSWVPHLWLGCTHVAREWRWARGQLSQDLEQGQSPTPNAPDFKTMCHYLNQQDSSNLYIG